MSKICFQKIRITEVGPRDGFQNIKHHIATEIKIKIIKQLIESGIKKMEITSMVSPKAIPQLADSKEVINEVLTLFPNLISHVLVPNLKGAQIVYELGIRHINYVISVSPAHNKANINRTHEESIEGMKVIRQDFPDMDFTLSLATVFGCPFIGATSLYILLKLIEQAHQVGINAITLCDTIGVANPVQTQQILTILKNEFPDIDIGMHMHNTHGMALANMLVGLNNGISRFETAIGGLGGCPFAPGAAGNAATEDLVNMLNRMGYETDISIPNLLLCNETIKQYVEPNLLSSLSKARLYDEFNFNAKLLPIGE